MLKLLQVHLGFYKLDRTRAVSIISARQVGLIKALLRKGRHRERRILLKQLLDFRFFDPAMITSLLKVISSDSIKNAQLAQQILEEKISMHPEYLSRFETAKSILADKIRRKENRLEVQDTYQLKSANTLADRKAQMNRLAKVKEDVKKGMRRMG